MNYHNHSYLRTINPIVTLELLVHPNWTRFRVPSSRVALSRWAEIHQRSAKNVVGTQKTQNLSRSIRWSLCGFIDVYGGYCVYKPSTNRWTNINHNDWWLQYLVGFKPGWIIVHFIYGMSSFPLTFTPWFFKMVKSHHQPDINLGIISIIYG